MPVKTADYIVLYKSRDGEPRRKSTPGIVGLFKVTGEPHEVNRGPLSLMFPMQVPWQAIMACTDHPLPIAPLVPSLKMFPNKKNYGSALQGSMKKLTPGDYDIIASAFNQHLAALDTAHNLTT
jgi:predicted RNA-binding protein